MGEQQNDLDTRWRITVMEKGTSGDSKINCKTVQINALFKNKQQRKWTWWSVDNNNTKNEIDLK